MAPAVMAAGTGFGMGSAWQQGLDIEKISEARAEIDIENAKAAERLAGIKAGRIRRTGREKIASRKARTAAGNIVVGTGSGLVVEAQMRKDILEDIGFTYETGQQQARGYRASAAIERARGEAARRSSLWDAISIGLGGYGSIAMLGQEGKKY